MIRNYARVFLASCLFQNLFADVSSEKTAVSKALFPIEISGLPSGMQGVDCIYIISLEKRPERWERTERFFREQGLSVQRVHALNGWELPAWKKNLLAGSYALRISPGALGCLISHLSAYKDAYDRGFHVVWICEDDVNFAAPREQVSAHLKKLTLLDPQWDLFHTDPAGPLTYRNDPRPGQDNYQQEIRGLCRDLAKIRGRMGMHSVLFSRRGLKKMLDYFTTRTVWSELDVDVHYIPDLRQYAPTTRLVTILPDSHSDTEMDPSIDPNAEEEEDLDEL